jgi:hypothetical protein
MEDILVILSVLDAVAMGVQGKVNAFEAGR